MIMNSPKTAIFTKGKEIVMNNEKQIWIIEDWAGNRMRFNGEQSEFDSFEDAEDVLVMVLGDDYESDRGEYYVVPKRNEGK